MAPNTRNARRRASRAAALLLVLGVSGGLGACSVAEDAANDAADAVKSQICNLVGDGTLSTAEIETLERVLDRAHDLGLPADLLDPAHEVVTAGKATTAEVNQIKSTCA